MKHSLMHRDSRPPPHDDYHEALHREPEHRPSKALSRAIRKPNNGNPSCAEHDKICSHHGRVHRRDYG
jgi:hypothetical protein